jgi:hypothetical protein
MATRTSSTFSRLHFKEPSVHHLVGTLPDGAGLPISYADLTSRGHLYTNHFTRTADLDLTNDWTVWESAAGATQAISDDNACSFLRLTNTTTDNDICGVQFTGAGGAGEFFRLRANKKRYFKVRFRAGDSDADASSVEQMQIFMGFQITAGAVTDLVNEGTACTDFLGFYKGDSETALLFVSGKNNAVTTAGTLSTNAANTIAPISTGLDLASTDAVDSNGAAGLQDDGGSGEFHTLSFLIRPTSTVTTADVFIWIDETHYISRQIDTDVCDDENLCLTLATSCNEVGGTAHVLDIANVMFWSEY